MTKITKFLVLLIVLAACESAEIRQQKHFLKGKIAFADQDYDEALRNFDEALELNPEDVLSMNNRALTLHRMGELDEALHQYNNLLEVSDDGLFRYNRGNVQYDIGNYFAALKDVDEIENDTLGKGKVEFLRALILERLDRFEESLDSFDRAAGQGADNNEVQINKASLLYYLERFDDAEKELTSYFSRDSLHSEAFNTWGLIQVEKEQYQEAVSAFEKAIELEFNNAYYFNNRGKAYLLQGNLRKAFSDFKISKSLDSDNLYLIENLAEYHWKVGEYDQAAINFLELSQLTVEQQNKLVAALFRSGNQELACTRLMSLQPTDRDPLLIEGIDCQ
jgi:tetratricopeptide (TPR) repeat protein